MRGGRGAGALPGTVSSAGLSKRRRIRLVARSRWRARYATQRGPGRAPAPRHANRAPAAVQRPRAETASFRGRRAAARRPAPGRRTRRARARGARRSGSRSSSQRPQPTSMASTPSGAWVTSIRYSALRFSEAWEWVRSSAPPTEHRMGKTRAARGERMRPVRTIHSKVPKPSTSSTKMRCCTTSD